MKYVIGIDVGISTTKIVGIRNMKVTAPLRINATDPVTSLYGALGKYLCDNKISISDIEQVILTGVGSAYVDKLVYDVPMMKADEFQADGLGARFESQLDDMLVVSMGTGTSFVRCKGDDIHHIGGIGIGGGTLNGLSRLLLKTDDIRQVAALAMRGDIKHANLLIGDISAHPLPGLPMNATASLLGRITADACKEDIAVGIIHMVLQSIGSAAVLAALNNGTRELVLIGNLTLLPQCRDVFPLLEKLYKVHFSIPKYAKYCTAIGAALYYLKTKK